MMTMHHPQQLLHSVLQHCIGDYNFLLMIHFQHFYVKVIEEGEGGEGLRGVSE